MLKLLLNELTLKNGLYENIKIRKNTKQMYNVNSWCSLESFWIHFLTFRGLFSFFSLNYGDANFTGFSSFYIKFLDFLVPLMFMISLVALGSNRLVSRFFVTAPIPYSLSTFLVFFSSANESFLFVNFLYASVEVGILLCLLRLVTVP